MNVIEALAGGFLRRLLRITLEASPYLLLGFAVAGLLRSVVGPARLRRAFEGGRLSGPFRAWGAAILAPTCALGVLPILRELQRSGVRRDAVLTFAIAAPAFHPITILGLCASLGAGTTALLLMATAAASILAGVAVGRSIREETPDEPMPRSGRPRMAAAAVHGLREAAGPAWRDVAVGAAVASLVSAVVSPSWLADGTFAGDPWGGVRMALVSGPAYVSPESVSILAPEMVKFRQSAAAMTALAVLGAGLTAGHLVWGLRAYGRQAIVRWGLAIALTTSLAGWGAGLVHVPVGTVNPDNDHYDVFVSPIPAEHPSSVQQIVADASKHAGVVAWIAPAALAIAAGFGLALRSGRLGRWGTFEAWTSPEAASEEETPRGETTLLDRPLPPGVVRGLAAATFLGLLIPGAWALFPSPAEAFDDMSVVKADYFGDIGAGDPAVPLHHLDRWERLLTRLPIGAVVRLQFPDAEARRLSTALAEDVRKLRAATTARDLETARALFHRIQPVYNHCRRAYHAG